MVKAMVKGYSNIDNDTRILVTMEELCTLLSCGRRNATKIVKAAKAEVIIGNLRRINVDKIRDFLYQEAM